MRGDPQAWAYCDVRRDGTITYYEVGDAHRVQPRPNIAAVNATRWAEEAVAWLGLQGWELVSVSAGTDRTFYFKRPIDTPTGELEALLVAMESTDAGPEDTAATPDDGSDLSLVDQVRLLEEEFLPD